MKVPQHTIIIFSSLKACKASEELQEEVEARITTVAKASEEDSSRYNQELLIN